jgi:hypothetical protein
MAALTGNQIKNSYPGLLKTTDNAALPASIPGVITDGVGNTSPLKLSQTAVEMASDNILITNAAGDTGMQIDGSGATDVVIFAGALDFNSVTSFSGLPAAGLVNGSIGTDSIVSAASLTTTAAQADSVGNIGIGNNAQATGGGVFARSNIAIGTNALANNEVDIAIGANAQATGSRTVAVGAEASASGNRAVAVGIGTNATSFTSICIGNYSTANAEGAIVLGGYGSTASGSFSAVFGRESSATAPQAYAIGYGITASTENTVTLKRLQMLDYASLNFADDTAAAAAGIPLGGVYHTSGALKIRIA